MSGELDLLARAHALFAGRLQAPGHRPVIPGLHPAQPFGVFGRSYAQEAADRGAGVSDAGRVDAELIRIIAAAGLDHDEGRRSTGAILAAARSDTAVADSPIAARELLQRRAARLRAQRRHLLTARRRARRRRAALRALRYAVMRRRGHAANPRADIAVRAALSRLGCPYVWGATGPSRFDCSGLMTWAYRQAGVPLHRTTYEQINDGVPVARSQVRPGDLVFPHTGHVQMAIGSGLVVEAPYAGATVRISPLGSSVAIRRPL